MWWWRRGARTPTPVFKDADDKEIPSGEGIEREVAENTPAGEPVGDPVVAADAEGDVLTYSLGTGGDDDFLRHRQGHGSAVDEEPTGCGDRSPPTAFRLRPLTHHSPKEPESDMITVTITVTNVQEPPKITEGAAAISHPENSIELDTDVYTDNYR